MDHIRILRRAFDITLRYRALWVFGILIALFTSRGGGGNNGQGANYQFNQNDLRQFPNIPPFHFPTIPPDVINSIIGIAVGLVCLILILVIVGTIIRYVSTAALIRMTNTYEATGEKVRVGQGFRLGWSQGTFTIWLLSFLIGLVSFLAFLLLIAIAAAPLLLWTTNNTTYGAIGTVITIGLALLVILFTVVAAAVLSLIIQIARRVILLENRGMMEGLRQGWTMVRRRLGDVIIMGLIMFGLGLVFAILMIPVVLLLLVAAVAVGAVPGLIAGGVSTLFAHGEIPALIGVLVGLPFFLLTLIIPLAFIGGLYEVFSSNVWTLTYRELLALESVAVTPAPVEPVA